jgi:hypothetical protein
MRPISQPVIPAKAGIQSVKPFLRIRLESWAPAFAGATGFFRAVVIFIAMASSVSASDGFEFLEMKSDPRRAALAGAGVALTGDAVFSANPAGLAETARDEISLSYASGVVGTSFGGASYVHPLSAGGAGLRVLSLDYGTFDGYDASGGRAAGYAAKDLSLSAGYGRAWGNAWRWGGAVGQVRSTLGDASAETLEGNAGVLWAPSDVGPFSGLKLGAAVRHLGAGGSFEKERAPLPRTAAVGLSWKAFAESWLLAADVEKPRTGKTAFAAGQELWVSPGLALRAGWRSDQDLTGAFTLGLGMRFKDLRVDYAFAPGQGRFGDTHRAGLSWRFGGQVEALYEDAVRLLQKGDTAEAVLKLKKVLDLSPRHRRALSLMREAAERMRNEGLGR